MNEKRPGLKSLIKNAKKGAFKRVIITQEDRLTRFGFTYLEELLAAYGVEVVTLGKRERVSIQEELVADFMSLLASFSGRYYRLRGYSQQKEFLSKMETRLEQKE